MFARFLSSENIDIFFRSRSLKYFQIFFSWVESSGNLNTILEIDTRSSLPSIIRQRFKMCSCVVNRTTHSYPWIQSSECFTIISNPNFLFAIIHFCKNFKFCTFFFRKNRIFTNIVTLYFFVNTRVILM